jgi:hypothetical protein
VHGNPKLFEIILALNASGGLPRLLDGRKQQPHQDRYNGDDHQQFDQREPPPTASHANVSELSHGSPLPSRPDKRTLAAHFSLNP